MYRPITMYQIVCDRCGEVFGGTDTCSALFSNKEVDIGDYSDWEMIDGKFIYSNNKLNVLSPEDVISYYYLKDLFNRAL